MINFLSGLPFATLLGTAIIGVIIGDFFAKYWSLHHKPVFFALAIFGYMISAIFYTPTTLKKGLVISSVMWSVASVAAFLLIGILIFRESLTVLQVFGVVLGIASLLLLTL